MTTKTIILTLVMISGLLLSTNTAFGHHVSEEIPVSTSPMKMSLVDSQLFVSNLGQREITIIDTTKGEVTGKIETSSGVVAVMAIPERNVVYAATFESGGIDVYDLETKTYLKTIELPNSEITLWYSPGDDKQVYQTFLTGGAALDYNPNNGILYVANYNADYVATIDTATDQVLEEIPVSRHPFALKVDPFTGKVLVANMAGNEITFIVPSEDGKTHTISSTVATGTVPWGIGIDSMEHLAYVTHRGAHHITVLNILDESIVATIPVGDDTQAVTVDTSEREIYVSYLQQNKIVKINGATNEIITTIETGALAWDLVADSATHKIYSSMKGEDKVFVMSPQSIAMTLPVVTMQTPVAYVGEIMVHGQDVEVSEATVDIEKKALIINAQSKDGGTITLSIPRVILDSKQGSADSAFMVYTDDKLVGTDEITGDDKTRIVTIEVPKNTESVTISGTHVIPEFGPLAVIVLVASILSVIVLTKRHSLA